MPYILIIYYVLAFISLIVSSYKKSLNQYRVSSKLATSLGFIAIATYCGIKSGNMLFYYCILPAFVFCLIGDVLLAMTDDCGEKRFFTYGLISFLIGHILFLLSFCFLAAFSIFELILPIVAVLITLLILKSPSMEVGKMKPYILIYSFFVSWLFSKGLFVFLLTSTKASIIILIGSSLFIISDAIILFLIFYKKKLYATRFFNLLTYYAATLALALCILYV